MARGIKTNLSSKEWAEVKMTKLIKDGYVVFSNKILDSQKFIKNSYEVRKESLKSLFDEYGMFKLPKMLGIAADYLYKLLIEHDIFPFQRLDNALLKDLAKQKSYYEARNFLVSFLKNMAGSEMEVLCNLQRNPGYIEKISIYWGIYARDYVDLKRLNNIQKDIGFDIPKIRKEFLPRKEMSKYKEYMRHFIFGKNITIINKLDDFINYHLPEYLVQNLTKTQIISLLYYTNKDIIFKKDNQIYIKYLYPLNKIVHEIMEEHFNYSNIGTKPASSKEAIAEIISSAFSNYENWYYEVILAMLENSDEFSNYTYISKDSNALVKQKIFDYIRDFNKTSSEENILSCNGYGDKNNTFNYEEFLIETFSKKDKKEKSKKKEERKYIIDDDDDLLEDDEDDDFLEDEDDDDLIEEEDNSPLKFKKSSPKKRYIIDDLDDEEISFEKDNLKEIKIDNMEDIYSFHETLKTLYKNNLINFKIYIDQNIN